MEEYTMHKSEDARPNTQNYIIKWKKTNLLNKKKHDFKYSVTTMNFQQHLKLCHREPLDEVLL